MHYSHFLQHSALIIFHVLPCLEQGGEVALQLLAFEKASWDDRSKVSSLHSLGKASLC